MSAKIMTTELPILKIFVSSPGDVNEERIITKTVIERLEQEFATRVILKPIFWEHEPMLMTETFQTQITPPSETEIFICILWSRIGTRLPAQITREDGSRYDSGTEFEFEDAWQGAQKNGYPDILVYRKMAEPPFLRNSKAPDFEYRLEQKKALDEFCRHWFQDDEGSFIAAFNPFDDLSQFEERLDDHLRKLLERRYPLSDEEKQKQIIAWTDGSPFRGLEPFNAEHAPIFFGRTKETGEVLQALRQQAHNNHAFVLVLGMSGSGKSSLIRAGVLPLLTQAGVIENIGLWRQLIIRPSDIQHNLVVGFVKAFLHPDMLPPAEVNDTHQLYQLCDQDNPELLKSFITERLHCLAEKQGLTVEQTRLIVCIDQMEEIFTLEAIDQGQRTAFIRLLSTLVKCEYVWVVATFRSDFYHRCTELPQLVNLMEGNGQYLLAPPTVSGIRQIIQLPTLAAGLYFETHPTTKDSLGDVLLDSMVANPRNLSLLEFTLDALYQQREEDGCLSYAAYDAMGGIEGALAKKAEQVFTSVSKAAQAAFPHLMRVLITISKQANLPTSGKYLLPTEKVDNDVANAALHELLNAFIEARLLVTDQSEDGQAFARIAHEALLFHWPRLCTWIGQYRNFLQVRVRVDDAAGHWINEGRLAELLLPEGKPLNEAEELLELWQGAIKPITTEYINASLETVKQQRRAKEQAAQRKLHFMIRMSVTFAILMIVAIIGASYGFHQARIAKEETKSAEVARTEAEKARKLTGLMEKGRTLNLFESRLTHAALLMKNENYSQAKQILYRSKLLENRVKEERLYVQWLLWWYVHLKGEESQQIYPLYEALQEIAVHPNLPLLAVGDAVGRILYVNTDTGAIINIVKAHTSSVRSLVFHPILPQLISSSHDKWVRVWTLPDSKNESELVTEWKLAYKINALDISPDGHYIVTGGRDPDYHIHLWDMMGQLIQRFTGHKGRISENGLKFSHSGKQFVSGSYDKTVRVWNVETGDNLAVLKGHVDDVESVIFSSDDSLLASSSTDKTIRIWDTQNYESLHTLQGHINNVLDIRFIHNDSMLVSGSRDSTLRVWDIQSGVAMKVLQGHTAAINGVDVKGDHIFSAGFDGTIRRWSSKLSHQQHYKDVEYVPVSTALVLSQHASLIGSKKGQLQLIDLESTEVLWSEAAAHKGRIERIHVSTDEQYALTIGHKDKMLKLWQIENKTVQLKQSISLLNTPYAVRFSKQGHYASVGDKKGNIFVYQFDRQAETLNQIMHITAHDKKITSLAFPNEANLLSSSEDGYVKHWQLGKAKIWSLKYRYPKKNDLVTWIDLDDKSNYIASVGRNSTSYVYHAKAHYQKYHLIGHESRVIKAIFAPHSEILATASTDATISFWDRGKQLLVLRLPAKRRWPVPLYDFDFKCSQKECWVSVPLTRGKIALYHINI